ncbi:hypothetical protein KKC94_05415 [Patescibacteria group bacterium]|nr:hypothetical protein [Patescibacteria group bacterium]
MTEIKSQTTESQLTHEEMERMTAQEIIKLGILHCGKSYKIMASEMSKLRPDYNQGTGPAVSSRQLWQMAKGVFTDKKRGGVGVADIQPRYIAVARYFFPNDEEAQTILLKKIKESIREGYRSPHDKPTSSAQLTVRLSIQSILEKMVTLDPNVSINIEPEGETNTLILSGTREEIRKAVSKIMESAPKNALVGFTEN